MSALIDGELYLLVLAVADLTEKSSTREST